MRKDSVLLIAALVGSLGAWVCASQGAAIAAAAPVTKEQLLSMTRDKVDPKVIRAIVERDCVDFDVDAGNAAELSRALPPEVLEAAIGCRAHSVSEPKAAEPKAAPPAPSPEAPQAAPATAVPAGEGTLRVSAEFIGESASLSCSFTLDGRPLAVLTKPAEGEFGQAVPRVKIVKESPDIPVASGKHGLLVRCDPKGQEISREIQIEPGRPRAVRMRENTLRHWKLARIE